MDVTKPYKIAGLGDVHGPNPYEFRGFRWVFISQTQVLVEKMDGWMVSMGVSQMSNIY